MAIEAHVKLVRQGPKFVNAYRDEHKDETLDLSNADLKGLALREVNLEQCNLEGAKLGGADLQGGNLRFANLRRTNLSFAKLARCNLLHSDLSRANCTRTDFQEAELINVSLSGADLRGANLHQAHLNGANIARAFFEDADVDFCDFAGVRGAVDVRRLMMSRFSAGQHPTNFEKVERLWTERWFDWSSIKVVGRLPLFGVSYLAVIALPLFFFVLAFYNSNLDQAKDWARGVGGNNVASAFATLVTGLPRLEVPSLSLTLLVSAVLLAAASTIYALWCPSRIKEFSQDQWVDELNKPLFHYWPIAWELRWLRLLCAVLYAVGGLGALYVIGSKVINAAVFIFQNS